VGGSKLGLSRGHIGLGQGQGSLHFVMVLLAVGLGYLVWNSPSQANQPTAARVAPAPEVAVVTMQEKEVRLTTELPGRTAAYQTAEIRPQVGGIIQKRAFTEGAEIKADGDHYDNGNEYFLHFVLPGVRF